MSGRHVSCEILIRACPMPPEDSHFRYASRITAWEEKNIR